MVASPELIIDGTSSQENIEGTHERVNESIKKELEWLKNEIWWNEFYSSKENWEVEYKMDVVQKYLETKKDKSYVELLNSKNTAAWIMAVQIVLCSVGYDVGKVDWILKNKWAKTSKTIEQIIKFQKDNWLKPDWKPGWKTIKKLLEKLWSTDVQAWNEEKQDLTAKEEKPEETKNEENIEKTNISEDNVEVISKENFDELCFKTELSDEEIKQVVDYANKEWWSWLSLRINKIKNQNQLNELWKIKSALFLNNIKTITDEQLKWLCNVKQLWLWVTKITSKQAEIVSNSSIEKLELFSLNGESYKVWDKFSSMSNYIVDKLAKSHNLKELIITYTWLTLEQKKVLKDKIVY